MKFLIILFLIPLIARAEEFQLPRDFFPITPWELVGRADRFSADHYGLDSLAECGFNTAAFVTPDQLPLCEKLNLKAITGGKDWDIKWRELSDQQIDQTIRDRIETWGKSPAVIGYFIMDEPGAKDFPALAKAVAAVKKHAPGKLAYINLFPDYATLGAPDISQLGTSTYTEYLERFVTEVKPQILSYDNYQVQYSMDLKNPAPAASYFRNLVEFRRVAQKYNLPYWNIVSSNQIRPHTPPPSPANLALQAYTTLAVGYTGLTWYTYYDGSYRYSPINDANHRTPTWSHLKTVNDQVRVLGPILRKLKSTGIYFTSPQSAPDLPSLPGKSVDAITADAPMMLGEFEDANNAAFAMVVNLSLDRTVKFTLKLREPGTKVQQLSPVDASLSPIPADNTLWLPAGQGLLLKLK